MFIGINENFKFLIDKTVKIRKQKKIIRLSTSLKIKILFSEINWIRLKARNNEINLLVLILLIGFNK